MMLFVKFKGNYFQLVAQLNAWVIYGAIIILFCAEPSIEHNILKVTYGSMPQK